MADDWFTRAFGAGVADVREKLLEGWFGKGFEPAEPSGPARIDFGDWLSGGASPIAPNPDVGLGRDDSREPTPDPATSDHDRGIDL